MTAQGGLRAQLRICESCSEHGGTWRLCWCWGRAVLILLFFWLFCGWFPSRGRRLCLMFTRGQTASAPNRPHSSTLVSEGADRLRAPDCTCRAGHAVESSNLWLQCPCSSRILPPAGQPPPPSLCGLVESALCCCMLEAAPSDCLSIGLLSSCRSYPQVHPRGRRFCTVSALSFGFVEDFPLRNSLTRLPYSLATL